MAPKTCLRVIICFLLVSLSETYLKVESIYHLWLKEELISNSLLLKLNKTIIKEFFSVRSFDTHSLAKMKLLCEKKGHIGKELKFYNTVICNVCID